MKQLKDYLQVEVYQPYEETIGRKLKTCDRFISRHLSSQLNAIYLVRKMLVYSYLGGGERLVSKLIHILLVRRYGMYISHSVKIGLGLKIYHPTSIVMTNATIGDNFTIFQGCTIGQKYAGIAGYGLVPTIGNNVTMYANSSIIGKVRVTDNVVLAAHSLLIHDALVPGVYAGCPAKLIKPFTESCS